jgi:ABC-type multidrug transport system fused ATPase/permease subunit
MLDVNPAATISGLTFEVLHGSAFIFPCPSRPNLRPALDARALLTTSWLPGTSELYYFQRRSTWLGFSSTSFSLRFRCARCLPIGRSNALNTAAMSADLNLPKVNGDQLNLSGPIGGLQGGVETRGNGDDVRTEIAEVELRNVTLKYGDKMILDGVNLTINRGEAVALIGPSGRRNLCLS